VAEFSSHAPGTFSWVELATTDQKAGIAFYRALFGWDVNEQPIGPTEVYSMFLLRGKEVAAASTMRPEERQSGVPSHWNLYVTVAHVDESVKRAEGLGAKVFAAPFDVMDVGRMAVLQDPTGAVFQMCGKQEHTSARRFSTSQARSAGASSRPAIRKRLNRSTRRCLAGPRSTALQARTCNTRSSATRVSQASE
jgi:predicted enzyme related to lactoylglutathione lyase